MLIVGCRTNLTLSDCYGSRWHILQLHVKETASIFEVTLNVMEERSWEFDKGWSSALGFRRPTAPVRCPSRLMNWSTRFVTLPIVRTWQVEGHLFIYSERNGKWDCISLPNASETHFFSNSPITRSQKLTNWPNGLAKRCRHERRYFWKTVSETNARRTADLRYMFLLSGVPCWTYSDLSSRAISGLPMYYVNRNDELMLPHPVECGLVDVFRNFVFRTVGVFLELLALRLEYSVHCCAPVCIPTGWCREEK